MAGTCQSFLQKLPLEVRLLIYEQCFFAERENCRVFRPSWADLPKDTTAPSIPPTSPATYPIKANITALPLILTCRQIYDEAVPVLYSGAKLYFDDLAVLKRFLEQLPVAQRDLIRTIHLEWASFVWFHIGCMTARDDYLDEYWQPVCKTLSSMRSLKDLRICIRPCKVPTRGRQTCDMTYLEPLKAIRARNFVLEV